MKKTDIFSLLSKPSIPFANHGNWPDVETQLELRLPSDYKKIVEFYGTGKIGEFIWIYSPFSKNKFLNLFSRSEVILDSFREVRERSPEAVPYNLYPERGGLLPWGSTANGDFLFWLTDGSPNHWPAVIAEARAPEYVKYDMTVTDLLFNLLTKRIRCPLFPDNFPPDNGTFVSEE